LDLSRRHLLFLASAPAFAQNAFLPLAQLRPGLTGTGRTVFRGTQVSQFSVEILGILPNTGPGQSIILARLSGPEIERTGVMQGMSGSPVYVDGKLIGAIALAFSFSKEPIAGIRPIEEMFAVGRSTPRRADPDPSRRLTPIATPISFSGFSPSTLLRFGPELRRLGLEPRQAIAGGSSGAATVQPGPLEPGAMISVQLMTGDMSVAADGTVTYVDGDQVLAFGHEFLQLGPADLPFARAEVLALLPSLDTSFKISVAREPLGVITHDQLSGIRGVRGRQASLVPFEIRVRGESSDRTFRMQAARDPVLTPFLLNMAAYSALESDQRMVSSGSVALSGNIAFEGDLPDLTLSAAASGEFAVAQSVAQAAATPLQCALQGDFPDLRVRGVRLEFDARNSKRSYQLEQVFPHLRAARPGETVPLTVILAGSGGALEKRTLAVTIPPGYSGSQVSVTLTDAFGILFSRYARITAAPPVSAADWIRKLNLLAQSNRLYLRLTRPNATGPQLRGEEISAPVSVARLLTLEPPSPSNPNAARAAPLAELEIPFDGITVSGSKSFSIEVKPA
jgi:hypothetical protein